ncbi:MAG: response regulator [Desulfobulbus sp.]|jgi:DNA-binding response OmpR family regulator|uniref:response regulator n=1 Tax=Desulfobulbus sp. TaxID=895 RepID=UPI00284A3C6B|nr:response regulator [Desulfobulbus sp.]MDR2551145.1 response regulator [Desulfobulbus sp.]
MPVSVLLVDDDEEFLAILAERLTIRGLEVTTAASGRAALDLFGTAWFKVVVLDLQMPDMDGLEVLERLVALNPVQQIIVLTGHATVTKGVRAMKLGAADLLEKPVDIRELVEKIKSAAASAPAVPAENRAGRSPYSPQEAPRPGLLRTLRGLFAGGE